MLNKANKLPLYYQLYEIILNQINSGIFKEHDKIPSEREFCDKYNISRSTIRQAINELERDGYVYKRHGKGIFVCPKTLKQDLFRFYSFTEEMKKLGKKPTSEVINFEIINDVKIANKMKISINDNLYKITRLRLADDEPVIIETSYLPVNRFPNLTREKLDNTVMYDIFREEYGVDFSKAEEIFKPVITRSHEARILNIKNDIPSMMIERYAYEGDKIIIYSVNIARGDKFEYRVILNK
ncbi:MAG TPA: GntR family transcriptional regulator [Haloplasmataceae bacterium]